MNLPAKAQQTDTAYNQEYYDAQWSSLTDYIKYNPGARHRRKAILDIVKELKVDSVLDVGCGNGMMIREMKGVLKGSPNFHGADLSGAVVEQNQNFDKDSKYYQLDIQKDSLPKKFDLIVCSEVIEHLENRTLAYQNLRKMLNPGGYLLITCPGGTVYETERHFGHVSHPDQYELHQLGEGVGLQALLIRNWGFPFYSLLKWVTNINAEWSLKNFGETKYSFWQKAISTFLYYLNFFNLPSSTFGCQYFALYKSKE